MMNCRKLRSQSLCFQGVLLRHPARRVGHARQSQSLCFQGVLLRLKLGMERSLEHGLNPFVFRAYYCELIELDGMTEDLSQSLCFQGVLLR